MMKSSILLRCATVVLVSFVSICGCARAASPGWLSPTALVAAPDGSRIFVACASADRVLAVDVASRQVKGTIKVPNTPTGLAISSDGRTLYVTCAAPESQVCVIDLQKSRIAARLKAGHTAMAPVISADGKSLFVCNRFNNDVRVLDLPTGKELRRIAVRREPVAAALTHDGKHLLVANHLHTGPAIADYVGAVLSVIETDSGRVVDDLRLPNGSGALNDISVSPDGNYAVATHTLSRFTLPTTQIDRGWMNTSAQTIIDLQKMQVLNTVLLDTIDHGAANPWGVGWSRDGKKLVVALAGTHEVSITDFPALIQKLAALTPPTLAPVPTTYSGPASRVTSDVPNDLSFLVGLRERWPLPEGDLGPRSVVVIGQTAYLANYFSDTLTIVPVGASARSMETMHLGPKPVMTRERLGEFYFNNAKICFQQWQSCSTCHPGDARVDALNWDLLNDGLGNPKNTKSMLLAFKTPPAMSSGVRESAEAAVRAGIRHILFTEQPPAVAEALGAYIRSLKPVPSPYLVNGKLSKAAERGKKLFASKEVGCAQCHPAPLFTDLKPYDVATGGFYDRDNSTFDTPTLVEIWRTAPYLHDGTATLREVLVEANHNDRHGKTSHLSADQINDLLAYLLSL